MTSTVFVDSEATGSGPTQSPEASRSAATKAEEGTGSAAGLPEPTAYLLFAAGAIAVERAASGHALRSEVEEILRRAVNQAAAVRGGPR